MMGYKNKKNTISERRNKVHCRLLAVCSPGHVADWELRVTAAAQNHGRVLYYILLAWARIKIQNLKHWFLLDVYCFHNIVKSKKKKSKSNHLYKDRECLLLFPSELFHSSHAIGIRSVAISLVNCSDVEE